MTREQIILGAAGGICAGLLIAALMLHGGGPPAGGDASPSPSEPAPAGASEAPAEGAATPEGGAAAAAPSPGSPAEAAAGPVETPAPQASPSFVSEQNRRDVVLFFQESEGENLKAEKRKIFQTSSVADQAKQIVVELINGPRDPKLLPTLPPETNLLGLYLDRAGTAYVDLSPEVASLHPGGTSEELATIFSLVDSLTYNLHEIKRVHILIGGEERDTLKDHLDLRRDYLPDLSIVDMDGKR